MFFCSCIRVEYFRAGQTEDACCQEERAVGRISRTDDNLFPFPKGAFVVNGRYVYINTGNRYVSRDERKTPGERGYTGHDQACIGALMNPGDTECRMFYANKFYRENFLGDDAGGQSARHHDEELPEMPSVDSCVHAGLFPIVSRAEDFKRLFALLADCFGAYDTGRILDLASFMISRRSASFERYPGWAREHIVFSENAVDEDFPEKFLGRSLRHADVSRFMEEWSRENIGSGRVYLCCDSIVQATGPDGVRIVPGTDVPEMLTGLQADTDIVLRQSDGMPLACLHAPGCDQGIAGAGEIEDFIAGITEGTGKKASVSVVADRGFITEGNLREMEKAGIGYMLMLDTSSGPGAELCERLAGGIVSGENRLSDSEEKYGITADSRLFEGGRKCCAHVIRSEELFRARLASFDLDLERRRAELAYFIESAGDTDFTMREIEESTDGRTRLLFSLELEKSGQRKEPVETDGGSSEGAEEVFADTFRITGFSENARTIDLERRKCGIHVIVSSRKTDIRKAESVFSERDSVREFLESVKVCLAVNGSGHREGTGLIWFVASVIYSIILKRTSALRKSDREDFTMSRISDELEEIEAYRDPESGEYGRRYGLNERQRQILRCFGLSENDIDECIDGCIVTEL